MYTDGSGVRGDMYIHVHSLHKVFSYSIDVWTVSCTVERGWARDDEALFQELHHQSGTYLNSAEKV